MARELLGEAPELWLDGGHNPHAGRAIARAMADMEERHAKPLIMIAGMQANKDARGFFEAFVGLTGKVFAVAAGKDGVVSAEDVAEAARAAGLDTAPCASVEEAMRLACQYANEEPPRLLIGGSLYLAGEVLEKNS